jgi:hypothetical protein
MAHLKSIEKNDELIECIRLLLLEAKPAGYASDTENWECIPGGGLRFVSPPRYGLRLIIHSWGANPFWSYEKIIDADTSWPVWFMGYHGMFFKQVFGGHQLITNKARIKGINNFLNEALLKPDLALPLRGQHGKSSGALVYYNHTHHGSNLAMFAGKEMITHGGEIRYTLDYNGGLIG